MNTQTLQLVELFIVSELDRTITKTLVKKELVHNHPPLRFKVDGCEYCQKIGNIFAL